MTTIKKNTIVPYTSRQMFELVNNIEEYPRFLPWCHSSQIISRKEDEVVASLEVEWKGLRKQLTTRNRLFPFDRMEIDLVSGPMQKLDGIWVFHSLDENACKISLDMEFEFSGRFIDIFFQPVFHHIANTLVEAFCKRAVELYGQF